MNNHELNLIIDEPRWEQALPNVSTIAEKVFSAALIYTLEHEDFDFCPTGTSLSFNLSLGNDQQVQSLNKEFRGLDKPTNVLSFANIDDPDFDTASMDTPLEMGDIIIALETLEKESVLKNITLHDHFCHLFTHGILHLMGFDHQKDEEAEYMEGLEVQILSQLNISNPYREE